MSDFAPVFGEEFGAEFGVPSGRGLPTLFDQLTGYWPLDESDGTRYNLWRDADHATDDGTVPSASSKALFISANSDYLKITDSAPMSLGTDTPFTLAIRFTPLVTVVGVMTLVSHNVGNNNALYGFHLYRNGDELFLRVGNGTTFATVNTTVLNLTIGQEYQVIAGHDPVTDRLSLKVDAAAPLFSAWAGGTLNSTGAVNFGRLVTGEFYLDGRLRDFHYWNGRYLTTAEQATLVNNPYPFGDTTYGINALAPDLAASPYTWHDFSAPSTQFTDALKATPVSSDGDGIRVIASKVGTHDWTAPSAGVRPLYKVAVQNSLSTGRWNGSDSQLNMDEAWPDTDYTAFLVVKNNDLVTGSHVMIDQLYLVLTSAGYDATPRCVIHWNDSPTFTSVLTALRNVDGWNIIEIVRNGTTTTLSNNGQNAASVTISTNFSPNRLGPNIANPAIWWADMDLGEVVRLNTAHDARTRAQIRAYLQAKWNISYVRLGPYRVVA